MERVLTFKLLQQDIANIVVALKKFPMDQVEELVEKLTTQWEEQQKEPFITEQ